LTALALAAGALWLLVLLLPWRPWSTREQIEPAADVPARDHSDVGVLIPARDEAATIGETLYSVAAQPGVARVVVVNDQSVDETAGIAGRIADDLAGNDDLADVELIEGQPAPPGWSGKLWAQQQGLSRLDTPLVLLLDADIRLAPSMLSAMLDKLESQRLDVVSIMATLPCESGPEKLMLPAFVYFFKQLYPFAWVNRSDRPCAAAAGGCVLVRREILERAGAFGAWRDALIDDCAMAAAIRRVGGRIWLGLSQGVTSMRRHPDLGSIIATITRTAYTQLGHRPAVLALVTLGMLLAFVVPPAAVLAGIVATDPGLAGTGLVGWTMMALGYVPQVRFAGLAGIRALTLPFAAVLFLYATLESAARYHAGAGAGWKGRNYGRPRKSVE